MPNYQISVNKKLIMELDSDPRINGVMAPVGSIGMVDDNTNNPKFLQFKGPLANDWANFSAGALTFWDINGTAVQIGDYFGSSNDQDIVIKRNNILIGTFKTAGLELVKPLDMTANKIVNIADATAPQDAVSKGQFDSAISALQSGRSFREFCRVMTSMARPVDGTLVGGLNGAVNPSDPLFSDDDLIQQITRSNFLNTIYAGDFIMFEVGVGPCSVMKVVDVNGVLEVTGVSVDIPQHGYQYNCEFYMPNPADNERGATVVVLDDANNTRSTVKIGDSSFDSAIGIAVGGGAFVPSTGGVIQTDTVKQALEKLEGEKNLAVANSWNLGLRTSANAQEILGTDSTTDVIIKSNSVEVLRVKENALSVSKSIDFSLASTLISIGSAQYPSSVLHTKEVLMENLGGGFTYYRPNEMLFGDGLNFALNTPKRASSMVFDVFPVTGADSLDGQGNPEKFDMIFRIQTAVQGLTGDFVFDGPSIDLLGTTKLKNVPDPIDAQDAVTKAYMLANTNAKDSTYKLAGNVENNATDMILGTLAGHTGAISFKRDNVEIMKSYKAGSQHYVWFPNTQKVAIDGLAEFGSNITFTNSVNTRLQAFSSTLKLKGLEGLELIANSALNPNRSAVTHTTLLEVYDRVKSGVLKNTYSRFNSDAPMMLAPEQTLAAIDGHELRIQSGDSTTGLSGNLILRAGKDAAKNRGVFDLKASVVSLKADIASGSLSEMKISHSASAMSIDLDSTLEIPAFISTSSKTVTTQLPSDLILRSGINSVDNLRSDIFALADQAIVKADSHVKLFNDKTIPVDGTVAVKALLKETQSCYSKLTTDANPVLLASFNATKIGASIVEMKVMAEEVDGTGVKTGESMAWTKTIHSFYDGANTTIKIIQDDFTSKDFALSSDISINASGSSVSAYATGVALTSFKWKILIKSLSDNDDLRYESK